MTPDGGLAQHVGPRGHLLVAAPSAAQLRLLRDRLDSTGLSWVRLLRVPTEALPLASGCVDDARLHRDLLTVPGPVGLAPEGAGSIWFARASVVRCWESLADSTYAAPPPRLRRERRFGGRPAVEALRSWRLRLLTVGLPALLAGSFEFVRHGLDAFAGLPDTVGNLITAGLALLGTLVYFHIVQTLVVRLTAEAERAGAEREALAQRQQVADELHDSISQTLFFLNVRLRSTLQRAQQVGDSELTTALAESAHATADAYVQVRDAIARLAQGPGEQPWEGPAALRRAVEEVAGTGLHVEVEAKAKEGSPGVLPPHARAALRAILLEAVRNVRKHAAAQGLRVWIDEGPDGGEAGVADDGIGFSPAAAEGYGLSAARRRAETAGLALSLESAPGAGTRLCVRWGRSARGRGPPARPAAATAGRGGTDRDPTAAPGPGAQGRTPGA